MKYFYWGYCQNVHIHMYIYIHVLRTVYTNMLSMYKWISYSVQWTMYTLRMVNVKIKICLDNAAVCVMEFLLFFTIEPSLMIKQYLSFFSSIRILNLFYWVKKNCFHHKFVKFSELILKFK
jgi:hypothetical protein